MLQASISIVILCQPFEVHTTNMLIYIRKLKTNTNLNRKNNEREYLKEKSLENCGGSTPSLRKKPLLVVSSIISIYVICDIIHKMRVCFSSALESWLCSDILAVKPGQVSWQCVRISGKFRNTWIVMRGENSQTIVDKK